MNIRVETPFPLYALPRVWAWTQEFRWRVADDFGPQTLEAFVSDWEARVLKRQTWAVYRDDELGGLITCEPESPVVGVVHLLFAKRFWGHATTLPALRLVFTEIFKSGLQKTYSPAFAENSQVMALLRQIGAKKEGVLRKHTRRGGKAVDMMIISVLAEEFKNG